MYLLIRVLIIFKKSIIFILYTIAYCYECKLLPRRCICKEFKPIIPYLSYSLIKIKSNE